MISLALLGLIADRKPNRTHSVNQQLIHMGASSLMPSPALSGASLFMILCCICSFPLLTMAKTAGITRHFQFDVSIY